jgi:hypothetical protein
MWDMSQGTVSFADEMQELPMLHRNVGQRRYRRHRLNAPLDADARTSGARNRKKCPEPLLQPFDGVDMEPNHLHASMLSFEQNL